MKNIIKPFLVLLGASTLSCTTLVTYDQYLRTWEGKTAEELYQTWGDSTHEVTLKSGEKLVVYVQKERNEVTCRSSFIIDKNEKIVSWKYEGGKCRVP